jgi:hypothetical protein
MLDFLASTQDLLAEPRVGLGKGSPNLTAIFANG